MYLLVLSCPISSFHCKVGKLFFQLCRNQIKLKKCKHIFIKNSYSSVVTNLFINKQINYNNSPPPIYKIGCLLWGWVF